MFNHDAFGWVLIIYSNNDVCLMIFVICEGSHKKVSNAKFYVFESETQFKFSLDLVS